jgi:WD40 repeat protein
VWSVGRGRLLWTRVLGRPALSSMAVFGPDGLLYASAAGGVQVLSPRDGAVLRTLWIPEGTVPHTRDSVRVMVQSTSLDIAVSRNGQVLAASGVSAEQGSGEVESKTPWLAVRSIFKPEPPQLIWPPSAVTGVRVSHDGRWIVGTALATAYVWDVETGSEVFRIPTPVLEKESAGVLTDAFVSPDGALLYTIHSGARPVVAWSLGNEVPAGAQCHLPSGSER